MALIKLTETDIAEMLELRDKGWSYYRLSQRFAVSTGTVSYHCLLNGALDEKEILESYTGEAKMSSRGKRVSLEEAQSLHALRESGMRWSEIVRKTGRPQTTIRHHVCQFSAIAELPETQIALSLCKQNDCRIGIDFGVNELSTLAVGEVCQNGSKKFDSQYAIVRDETKDCFVCVPHERSGRAAASKKCDD